MATSDECSNAGPILAAQYVRMSTEHQRYSIQNQIVVNAGYAAEHGLTIVRTYSDAGVSGLELRRRKGLQQLLADVVNGVPFSILLVYDVSRWGRFQDPDESAHYEFLCRKAGVRIEYCAEPFANDGSLTSALVKHLKRAMAAEYVRELSAKMRGARRGLSEQGYWGGGPCGYGFRRCAVAPDGRRLPVMKPGESKALRGFRTILVAGPDDEVKTVRSIFRSFVVEGLSMRSIAARLNDEGVPPASGVRWTDWRVRKLLTDEKCVGTLVVGRRTSHLRRQTVQPEVRWRRVENACPAIVPRRLFDAAQANIRRAKVAGADRELLAELREVLQRNGRLSDHVISADPHAHSASVFARRFGSLSRAYRLIGYEPTQQQRLAAERIAIHKPHLARPHPVRLSSEDMLRRLADLFHREGCLTADLIRAAPDLPADHSYRQRFGSLSRAYELVGYEPTEAQKLRFRSGSSDSSVTGRTSQPISESGHPNEI